MAFHHHSPRAKPVPMIVSSPHSGLDIPEAIRNQLHPEAHESPDADRFLNELYDFAPSLGAEFIHARYSRYVIDLNRSPDNKPLYTDGRQITGLVPVKAFSGNPLYTSEEPSQSEIDQRIKQYYRPYHNKLKELIDSALEEFGRVLVFEAHSISRNVPTISPEPFPDFILGNQSDQSCHAQLRITAERCLKGSGREVAINSPFQGGFITRSFGDPQRHVHTLQLEMCKDLYMDDHKRSPVKMAALKETLQGTLAELAQTLKELP